jgi:nickel-dependent lactate racemase
MKINSDSNNCKFSNSSFSEISISKSVNNSLSGDERAIPKKYKDPIGKPLLSNKEMTEEAIIRVYKKIENQLKNNQ